MTDPSSEHEPQTVWVVVKEISYEPSTVLGVYATKQLADLAADHPYDRSTVYEFPLVYPDHFGREAR